MKSEFPGAAPEIPVKDVDKERNSVSNYASWISMRLHGSLR